MCVSARERDVLFIRTGPPEGIISGAKIVSQLYCALHRCEPLPRRLRQRARRLSPKSSPSLSDVIRPILFLSLRRKGFESPLACPAYSVRLIQSAKCTPKSQKSIFCRRRPRLISRPMSRACNAAYFYPWPTSARRSAASLLFGHSRNRTRKKPREMRQRDAKR